ncbi:MAG: tetratricopeptide repeat protein [Ignavibacteriaceae bacterium]|nr:tetratricopeptide repeat protein [Ignavibacteriaceae bacterium]
MSEKLIIAETFRKTEKFQDALSLYEEILHESPHNAEGFQGAAYCTYHLHRLDDALRYSDLALELDQSLVIAHTIRAYVLNINGDNEKSRKEAKIAYELDNNSPDALCCYGTMLVFDGEFDSAIQMLEKATKIDSTIYVAHNNLAFAYSQKKNLKRQLHHVGIMFRLRPSIRNAIRYLGALIGAYSLMFSIALFVIMILAYLTKYKLLLIFPLITIVLSILSFFVLAIKRQWKEALKIFLGILIIGGATLFVYFGR